MRGGTQNRCGEISGEFVYPESQSPQPSPAGEGGPQAGCGGDPLRDCHASTDVWGSNFRFAFYMNLGTFNRCPLHIPPLRRGPSPAGEGRGLPVSVYVHLSYSVPSVFGQLVSAPTAMCLVGTYSPGVSPHRFCVPPLIRRLRAAPSPRGRFFSFPLGVYTYLQKLPLGEAGRAQP